MRRKVKSEQGKNYGPVKSFGLDISPIESHRYAVKRGTKVIGYFSTQDHADLMAATLRRADLIHELAGSGVQEMLAVIIDLMTYVKERKWVPRKTTKKKR